MVSQWCYSGVTVVVQWCYSGVTGVLQECYRSATGVLQMCSRGVTEELQTDLSASKDVVGWTFSVLVLNLQGVFRRNKTTRVHRGLYSNGLRVTE